MATILQKSKNCFHVKNSIEPTDRATVYGVTKINQDHTQILSYIENENNLVVIQGK
jgi:hypothetical protein